MQVNDGNFIEAIELLFKTSNRIIRSFQKDKLLQYQRESADDFLVSCMREFMNCSLPNHIRLKVFKILQKALGVIKGEYEQTIWNRLKPESKQTFKETIVCVFLYAEVEFRRLAANLLAFILVLETAVGKECVDILDVLQGKIESKSLLDIFDALTTINITWEFIKIKNITYNPSERAESLIAKVCTELTNYNFKPPFLAITLVVFASAYTITNNSLIDSIYSLFIHQITKATKEKNETLIAGTLNWLSEFIRQYPGNLETHSEVILQKAIQCNWIYSQPVADSVKTFFSLLVILEKNSKINCLKRQWNNITKSALEMVHSYSARALIDKKTAESLSRPLLLVMMSINGLFLEPQIAFLTDFILEHIDSTEETSKITALTCLSFLITLSSRYNLQEFLNSIFSNLLNFLSERSSRVRKGAVILILEMSLFYSEGAFSDQNLSRLLAEIMKILSKEGTDKETIKPKIGACNIILSLILAPDGAPRDTTKISENLNSIFAKFVIGIYTVPDTKLIDKFFIVINLALKNLVKPELLNYYFLYFGDILGQVYQFYQFSPNLKKDIIDHIFRLLAAILKKMSLLQIQLSIANKQINAHLHDLFMFVSNYSIFCKMSFPEGLVLAAEIARHNRNAVTPMVVSQFTKDHVVPSTVEFKDGLQFNAAIKASKLLANQFPIIFKPFARQIITNLLSLSLLKEGMTRESKVRKFALLKDMTILYPEMIEAQAYKIFLYIKAIFANLPSANYCTSPENKKHIKKLTETLADLTSALWIEIFKCRSDANHQFIDCFTGIQASMKRTCRKEYEPSAEYLNHCLKLVKSLANDRVTSKLIDPDFQSIILESLSSVMDNIRLSTLHHIAKGPILKLE
jgi:hypothetical protein